MFSAGDKIARIGQGPCLEGTWSAVGPWSDCIRWVGSAPQNSTECQPHHHHHGFIYLLWQFSGKWQDLRKGCPSSSHRDTIWPCCRLGDSQVHWWLLHITESAVVDVCIPAIRAYKRGTWLILEDPEGFLKEGSQFLRDTQDWARQLRVGRLHQAERITQEGSETGESRNSSRSLKFSGPVQSETDNRWGRRGQDTGALHMQC